MSEPQIKKRVRRRSLTIQFQEALNSAQSLDKEPTNDLTVSRMKFLQVRLDALLTLQRMERNGKLQRALAEVERLKSDNAKLQQGLAAAKPAARPMTDIERTLAAYEASKKNGGQ
jgi:hypothetical protein